MPSYAKPIADAVVTVIAALSGAPSLVQFRKSNVIHPRDTLPAVIVTIGEETVETHTFGATVFKSYIVGISIYRENAGLIASTMDTNPTLILLAKQALDTTTLSGVSVVWSVDIIENHSEWEEQEWGNGGEVSTFGLRVRTNEPRNG